MHEEFDRPLRAAYVDLKSAHPSASDSVVFLRHCALYKFSYLLTYLITLTVRHYGNHYEAFESQTELIKYFHEDITAHLRINGNLSDGFSTPPR